MQIKCRPVQGGDFMIEIEDSDDVETLKVAIFSTRPDLADEPEEIKVIYKGKVLKDNEQKVSDIGMKDNEFVAVTGKARPAAAAPVAAAAATPAAAPAAAPAPAGGYPAAQAPAAAPQMSQEQMYQQMMQMMAQTPGTLLGPPPEEKVQMLSAMGFPRDQVIRALRAAYNDADRAMGYLLDGNIPAEPAAMQQQAPALQQQPLMGTWPTNLLGAELLTKNGPQPTAQALGGAKVVIIYFSAHWCPPCKAFTPQLARGYIAQGANPDVQVVFITADRDQGSFTHYYNEMPWLAIQFGSPQLQILQRQFPVRGIPACVALDASNGNVLRPDAKPDIGNSRFDLAACCRSWGITPSEPTPLAPQAPAVVAKPEPPAPAKKPEPMALEIDENVAQSAMDRITEVEWEVQEVFYATLLKVLNNILQNPKEEKFRSLKKGNAALQTKLFGVADGAAVQLLKLGGFEEKDETIGLPGEPDGRCTSLRDVVDKRSRCENMKHLREERDKKIAEEVEKAKARGPAKSFGGDENGRMELGGGRKRGGGGG